MPDFEFMHHIMASLEADRALQAAQEAALQDAKDWRTNRRIGAILLAVAVILALLAESL